MNDKKTIIEESVKIIEQYPDQKLTLRQIYYRLVAKGIFTNKHNNYKFLSTSLIDARHNGHIPWSKMEDRTRHSYMSDTDFENVDTYYDSHLNLFKECYESYKLPRWYNQPKYVEVWIEKEAQQGIFEQAMRDLNVTLCPCKGYPSETYLYETKCRWKYEAKERDITILYFGDYDMRGKNIPKNLKNKLRNKFYQDFVVELIALNKDQIIKWNLIPGEAKATDSMATGWIEKEGNVAWEMDAIEPNDMTKLIQDAIGEYFDDKIYQETLKEQEEGKEELKEKLKDLFGEKTPPSN